MLQTIQKPYYNSEQDPLAHMVVSDYMGIYEDHTQAVQAELKREAVKYAGAQAITAVGRASVFVGRALFTGMTAFVESAQTA